MLEDETHIYEDNPLNAQLDSKMFKYSLDPRMYQSLN